MSDEPLTESQENPEQHAADDERREFLGNLGKWSGAAIAAAVGGAAWLGTTGDASAASWINRRGGWLNRGGGWLNGRGGGGGWVNRRGGGGWLNRR